MAEPTHKYLRLADLRTLRNLSFTSRRPVEGRYAGRHASPYRGQSVEFFDYRPYSPGEEVRDIDWKAYGRSDRLFVKLFEHQTDMSICFLIDGSASMSFRGVEQTHESTDSKYDYACRIAAGIGYLMTRQRDRAALAIAQEGLARFVPPGSTPSHMLSILKTMEHLHPAGRADLSASIDKLAGILRSRMLLLIFSDFLVDSNALFRSLDHFSFGGSGVVMFHVLHPDELNLPQPGRVEFEDSETGERLTVETTHVQTEYAQRSTQFLNRIHTQCLSRGMEYQLTVSNQPYTSAIRSFLEGRPGKKR